MSEATIEPTFLSDHNPITATLIFPEHTQSTNIWRLDASLFTNPSYMANITVTVKDFFVINDTPDTSHMTQWEAHKCMVRGALIKLASTHKHSQQEAINALLNQIQKLEQAHKLTKARSTLQELEQARNHLKEELGKKIRKNFILSQKLFYEHSNKSGKLLARALQAKKANNTMHKIRSSPNNNVIQQ